SSGRLRVKNEWVDAEIGFGLAEERLLFPVERLTSELARPVLIFHGLRDEVVPAAGSLGFIEKAVYPDLELRLYKAGDHRLLAQKDEMAEAACDFFAKRLGGE